MKKLILIFLLIAIIALLPATPVLGAIVIATTSASNVTQTSATLNGTIGNLGTDPSASVYFEWGTSTGYGKSTEPQTYTAPGPVSATITGLTPNTVYHFRMVAVSSLVGGTISRGANASFRTSAAPAPQPPPTPAPTPVPTPIVSVRTLPAGSVTIDSASLTGQLESTGMYTAIETWFDWGETPMYGNSTTRTTLTSPNLFSTTLVGLTPGRTYYFRSAARPVLLGAPPVYGSERIFTTKISPGMRVVTQPATDVSTTGATLAGTISYQQGQMSDIKVWFEWGTTDIYGNMTVQHIMSNPGPFYIHITGLLPGKTYYFRAVAFPPGIGSVPIYGNGMIFNTPAQPGLIVNTDPVSNVSATSAVLNGDVSAYGNQTVQVWFEWGPTSAYGHSTPPQTVRAPFGFNATISGLNPGALYHYRAIAMPLVANAAPVYGMDNNFATEAAPALMVSTNQATDISSGSATLRGTINSMGSHNYVQVWFEWGTSLTYGNTSAPQQKTATGPFSVNITGLLPNTTYHFRSVEIPPTTGSSAVYGTDISFTTGSAGTVSVITESATNITETTAVLNGDLASMGDSKEVQVWFEWGTTTAYGNAQPPQTYAYPAAFNCSIPKLSKGTTYHYKAVGLAPGKGSKVYGIDRVLTTSAHSNPAPSNDNLFIIWIFVMAVIVILIILLIILLASRRY